MPLSKAFITIQLEEVGGRPPFGRDTYDVLSLMGEVLRPVLCSWIKQETELSCFRVKGTEVASLVPIATPAGEGQIISFGLAAMLF